MIQFNDSYMKMNTHNILASCYYFYWYKSSFWLKLSFWWLLIKFETVDNTCVAIFILPPNIKELSIVSVVTSSSSISKFAAFSEWPNLFNCQTNKKSLKVKWRKFASTFTILSFKRQFFDSSSEMFDFKITRHLVVSSLTNYRRYSISI